MDEKYKNAIMEGKKLLDEKNERAKILAKEYSEKARQAELIRQEQLEKDIQEWIDHNLPIMLKEAALNGNNWFVLDDSPRLSKGIDGFISLPLNEIQKRIDNLEGFKTKFDPKEVMANYPSYDRLTKEVMANYPSYDRLTIEWKE